jgi:hypothetical protein
MSSFASFKLKLILNHISYTLRIGTEPNHPSTLYLQRDLDFLFCSFHISKVYC